MLSNSMGILGLALALALPATASAQDTNALWRIVHEQCVRHEEQFATPLPCVAVTADYAILKDRNGATQFLLIPTARVTGIDDPAVLAPEIPRYWEPAWEATRLVEAMANRQLPRDALSLAINSASTRSQDQLHIHVDCIRADVRSALRSHAADIGTAWASFPEPLAGHPYRAMRVDTLAQPGNAPFQALAKLPDARADMAHESLVVVGATYPDGTTGFYLLETRAGGGEELQDHDCAVAAAT